MSRNVFGNNSVYETTIENLEVATLAINDYNLPLQMDQKIKY
jgi:hypothetical protein